LLDIPATSIQIPPLIPQHALTFTPSGQQTRGDINYIANFIQPQGGKYSLSYSGYLEAKVTELHSGDTEPYFLLGPLEGPITLVATAIGTTFRNILVIRAVTKKSPNNFIRDVFAKNQWPWPQPREVQVTGECGHTFSFMSVGRQAHEGHDPVCPTCRCAIIFSTLKLVSQKPQGPPPSSAKPGNADGDSPELRQSRQQMFDYLGHAVSFMRDEPDWSEMLFGEAKVEPGMEMGPLEFSSSQEYWKVIKSFYGP
jgi:hypothetical protein